MHKLLIPIKATACMMLPDSFTREADLLKISLKKSCHSIPGKRIINLTAHIFYKNLKCNEGE